MESSKPPSSLEDRYGVKSSLWKIEGDQLIIKPHRGQKRALASKKRIVAVIAGAQSGKTTFGPIWLLKEMMAKGPGEYAVVSTTFPIMTNKCLPEFINLFEKGMKLGKYIKTDKKFYFSKAGLIKLFGTAKESCTVFFGYAMNPDSLESFTAKAVWCDEMGQKEFKLNSFYALMRRLAVNRGRMLITTTPYDLGWLKTKIYDPAISGKDPHIDIINFKSTDNPYFSQEEYDEAKSRMPWHKFQLFYNGVFEVSNGQIYDCYRHELHTVEPFSIPKHWKRVWGFDFGTANLACVKIAINPRWVKGSMNPMERRFYVYQTYRSGGKSVADHVRSLQLRDEGWEFAHRFGGALQESEWRNMFSEEGMVIYEPYLTGSNSVNPGIEKVYEAFSTGQLCFFKNLEEIEREVSGYQYKLDKYEEATDEIDNKNAFHRLDALRYAISEVMIDPSFLNGTKIVSSWRPT